MRPDATTGDVKRLDPSRLAWDKQGGLLPAIVHDSVDADGGATG